MSEIRPALPVASDGYEVARFNALRHGVLSRYRVLPWEIESEYQALLHALADEHQPKGPTEEHLVEEVAGLVWRKRRLAQAEAAAIRRGLSNTHQPFSGTTSAAVVHLSNSVSQNEANVANAIHATPEAMQADFADLAADEARTSAALEVLRAGDAKGYREALSRLREDTREWWQEVLADPDEDQTQYSADARGLMRFLQEEVGPWYENRRRELEHKPLIRSQALGEALEPHRLESLLRYEVHLDRKLERMLTMLLKLKELRRPAQPT